MLTYLPEGDPPAFVEALEDEEISNMIPENSDSSTALNAEDDDNNNGEAQLETVMDSSEGGVGMEETKTEASVQPPPAEADINKAGSKTEVTAGDNIYAPPQMQFYSDSEVVQLDFEPTHGIPISTGDHPGNHRIVTNLLFLLHYDRCKLRQQVFVEEGGDPALYECYNGACTVGVFEERHILYCQLPDCPPCRTTKLLYDHWVNCPADHCFLCEPVVEFLMKLPIAGGFTETSRRIFLGSTLTGQKKIIGMCI